MSEANDSGRLGADPDRIDRIETESAHCAMDWQEARCKNK